MAWIIHSSAFTVRGLDDFVVEKVSVAGLERMTTWSAVSALSYRATQIYRYLWAVYRKCPLIILYDDIVEPNS